MPDSKVRKMRAAIVGAGLMGRWHAHALTRAGGHLVAVADCRADAAVRLARPYRARAFTSLDELLAQVQVDVVHICTPLATHADLAARGLGAGAHLLIEKPLAPDADSTGQLIDLARSRGLRIVPVHQFVFQTGVQSALARVAALSPLVHLEAVTVTAGGADAEARDQLIGDILPHALGLFERFLPGGLESIEWTALHPAPGEIRAIGETQRVSLAINLSANGRPTRNTFSVLGACGSAHIDLFHGFVVFEHGAVSRGQKILRPLELAARTFTAAALNLATRAWRDEPAYPGLRELIRSFYTAIRTGAPAPFSPEEILAVARARDQLLSKFRVREDEP